MPLTAVDELVARKTKQFAKEMKNEDDDDADLKIDLEVGVADADENDNITKESDDDAEPIIDVKCTKKQEATKKNMRKLKEEIRVLCAMQWLF